MENSPCRILWNDVLPRERVIVTWESSPLIYPSTLHADIVSEWQVHLKRGCFNGKLARLDRWDAESGRFSLCLRPTDYRTLMYSNRHIDEILDLFGDQYLSKALGISAVVVSSDQQLFLMKRSQNVGEFPGALDVFGGHIDVPENGGAPDVFDAMGKELEEELLLYPGSYAIHLLGLLETTVARKPELVFGVECRLDCEQIINGAHQAKDRLEYDRLFNIFCESGTIDLFLQEHGPEISPSAYGCLQIFRDYLLVEDRNKYAE